MSDGLKIRDLTKDDLPQAVRLTEEMWFTESDYPGLSAKMRHDSAVYCASHYIKKATYARACESDGQFVGMLFGRVDGNENLFADFDFDINVLDDSVIAENVSIGHAYEVLYDRCRDKGYDCELLLYITDGRVRGKGIGSALLADYLSYLRSKGMKRMYLYTDDYCNTGFYLRKGFSNDSCEKVVLNGKEHDFFIFSCDL